MLRACLSGMVCAAALAAASFYPARLQDPRAVYLERPHFAVHADGAGDDAPALQEAIDRVQERHTYGIVFVPEGKYRLGRTVNIWRGIRLIGYGRTRPVFVLGERTPGYDKGPGKYMIHFRDARPPKGAPLGDARNTTFYSGISNIDVEIRDGNPAAVAARFRVAQLSSLEHMDFRIGSALGAVEAIGNEIEDCRFFGGEWAIRTGATSPGWQALCLDSLFEGQRTAAIETHDAGLTAIRCRFRRSPNAIVVTEDHDEKLFLKDSILEDISGSGITIDRYFDPRTQVNIKNVQCAGVPLFLKFREIGVPPSRVPDDLQKFPAPGRAYRIDQFVHGLHAENALANEPVRRIHTSIRAEPVEAIGAVPPRDFPDLPPQASWVNIASLGAKGDGEADDTAAFQEAIAKHRTIYVPIGRYRLTDTLQLRPGTALIGLHCMSTQFVLAAGTDGFTDPNRPKALIEAPQGGTNILAGIGFAPAANPGSVAVKWMADERSYMDDVFFRYSSDKSLKGKGQLYGLWVTDGGGGTFKNIWAPNDWAKNGWYVTNTSTPGRVYEVSVEHHVDVEVKLDHVSNWEFYALQTEENIGSEKAMAIDLVNCRDLLFANLFIYRIRASATPYPFAVRLEHSGPIVFRGLHNFSGGPFPFDYTLSDAKTRTRTVDREAAYVMVAPAPLEIRGSEQEKKLLKLVRPVYSKQAREAGIGGDVYLKAVIAEDGIVKDVSVLAGQPVLASAAAEAVRQWVYKPTLLNGNPVPVATLIHLNFALPAEAARSSPREVSGSDQRTRLLKQARPEYPAVARAAGISGVVELEAIVGKDGAIRNLKVLSGPYELLEAALSAVSHWIYKPAFVDGEPVEVRTRIQVNFSLTK